MASYKQIKTQEQYLKKITEDIRVLEQQKIEVKRCISELKKSVSEVKKLIECPELKCRTCKHLAQHSNDYFSKHQQHAEILIDDLSMSALFMATDE